VDVVVAGGHGKVGLRLLRLLAERGDRARGLIRNSDHSQDLEEAGAEAVVCDLEREELVTPCVEEADAIVFAAGAGPGSGPERKKTMDLGGAVKLIEAAQKAGIRRYVIVSSIGADRPEQAPEQMRPYIEAKAEADRRLQESGLDYTIVRPGRLTDNPGTGLVEAGPSVARGDIPRDDVAASLLAALGADSTVGKAFNLVGGERRWCSAGFVPSPGAS
jgi:nucleoside-diphosphate-sugar epimerase